jgi:putative DNA primase/helicase
MRDTNREWALRYAEAGISVFPCSTDGKKRPLVRWRNDSTTDALTIAGWWGACPGSLVGIDLHKCGLVVLDADRHSKDADGVVALSALLRSHHTDLGQVPITRTPSNGFHLYFRQPDTPLGNRSGDLPGGIDVRGSGGLTIAPYCIRPDGKSYRSVAGHPDLITAFTTGIIPVIPTWLVEIIRAGSAPMPPPTTSIIRIASNGRRETTYARTALAGCCIELTRMPPNTGRNNCLNGSAFRLGRMVARSWIDRSEVEHELREAAIACGLTADDGHRAVEATLQSGLNAGLSLPHADLKDRR